MIFEDYPQIRFCKVLKGTKKPFEHGWTSKPYDWGQILSHTQKEVNYGVLCGFGNLAVIDSDTPELQKHIEKTLPITFRVKTGSGGVHNYFFIPDLKEKIVLKTGIGTIEKHWGEVQSYGSQVIGPGSIHPNGNIYTPMNDEPITRINLTEFLSAISPFRKELIDTQTTAREEIKTYGSKIDDLRVSSIWGLSGMKKQGDEYYGSHPVHGSDGGMNFWINDSKNTWHCFRCNSGGGPLSAIAVKEGIINCSDAQRGSLRGEKAMESILLAKQKYGLKDDYKLELDNIPLKVGPTNKSLTLWTYGDFERLEKDTNFLVQDVIYPKTMTMLYSPPGEFKSILCLLMAMSVASGESWLGFETKKCPVLYCDKENNDQIIKTRLMSLFKGENYEDKELPLYILRRNGDLLSEQFINQLKESVKEKGIKLIFFDTLHRFADYDENVADDINRLYTFVFQPLLEEFGVSIVFLHHTKKDGGYRGSGDFLGMVDTAYGVYREKNDSGKTDKFRIVNEKCRAGEIENIYGEIDFGEDYIKILRLNAEEENEDKLSKLKELTLKIRTTIKVGEFLKKKDIEDRLIMEGYEFSPMTMKRSLKWLVQNNYLDKDIKSRYFNIG